VSFIVQMYVQKRKNILSNQRKRGQQEFIYDKKLLELTDFEGNDVN
jgi:hypothetical protein